jgi:exonuclease III
VQVKLLSWNVAGRVGVLAGQTDAVARQEPDIVALQEVRPSTAPAWRDAMEAAGLGHAIDSSAFANGRRIFNLVASRWELIELPSIGAPQPERVVSAVIDSPAGPIEVHDAHVPPSPSNGLAKVETCEALLQQLARPSDRHRVLCGDLNTPRFESAEGEVETFALHHPTLAERWDAAERGLLTGLAEWGFRDAFRALNGYDRRDVSWVMNTRARRKVGHRLDHVLASESLNPVWCDYEHGWREAGLSDHSGMIAVFEPCRR